MLRLPTARRAPSAAPRRRTTIVAALVVAAVLSAGTASAAVRGPDVSSYQHPSGVTVDWATAHTSGGADFAFVKATEGTGYRNPYLASDYGRLTALKMVRGAYHFARPSTVSGGAVAQARAFVAAAGTFRQHGELPPVLDLEVSGGLTPTQLVAWTRAWIAEVKRLTGRDPMIYTYPSFWRTAMAGSTAFTGYPLWLATYAASPQLVGGWTTYTFWQYTDRASVKGLPGPVDMSTFNGSLDRLWVLANGRYPTSPVVTAPTPRPSPAPLPQVGFTADRRGDVVGRTAVGDLYVYPAVTRGFAAPVRIATGWNGYRDVIAAGDVTGDGKADLLARTPAGQLYRYGGNGSGGLSGSRVLVGSGWTQPEVIATGDLDGDRRPDLVARTTAGNLVFFKGNGAGGFAAARTVGLGGWTMFSQLIGVGDVTGDGRADLLGRTPGGRLYLYAGLGNGSFGVARVVGTGFQRYTAVLSPGDLTGDGKTDLVTRTSTNVNQIWVGDGKGGFTASTTFRAPWGDTTRITGAR